jgi:hypothetical protein
MRKAPHIPAAVMLLLFVTLSFGCFQSGEREIHFFYEIACASCDEAERMSRLATRLMELRRKNPELSVGIHDLAIDSGWAAFEEIASRYEVETGVLRLPVLFSDGSIREGEAEVEKQLSSMENAEKRENK